MKPGKTIFWIIVSIVLAAALNLPEGISSSIKGGIREGLAPIQGLAAQISLRFRESIRSVRGIGNLVSENQRLASEMTYLQDELIRLRGLERENIDLKRLLQFQKDSVRKLVPCEVIARDVSGWWRTIRLSKGSTDGIAEGMAVVTPEGLIGKTVAVSPRTADVLLISDPTCKVSAQVSRGGIFGIVSGRGPGKDGRINGVVEFINKDKQVRGGDELITSGLGGIFPKGLHVGYVEHVQLDDSGLFQSATFIPRADIGALEYVFVVVEEIDPVRDLLRRRGMRVEGDLP